MPYGKVLGLLLKHYHVEQSILQQLNVVVMDKADGNRFVTHAEKKQIYDYHLVSFPEELIIFTTLVDYINVLPPVANTILPWKAHFGAQ